MPTTQRGGSTTTAAVQRRVVGTNGKMLWAELVVAGSVDADLEPYPWVSERCDLDWSVVKNVGVRIPADRATAFAAALVRCNIDDLPNQAVVRSTATLGSDSVDRCVFSEFLQTMVSYRSGRLFLARLADPLPDDFLLEVTVRSVLSCGVTSGDPHAVHREMVAALLE